MKRNLLSRHTMPPKSLGTPANFAMFCDFPISPSEQCCFVAKRRENPRLCWNAGIITFKINIASAVTVTVAVAVI